MPGSNSAVRSNELSQQIYENNKTRDIKVLFIDVPQLAFQEKRLDFSQLAQNLWKEFDDIRAYVGFKGDGGNVTGIIRSLAYAGIYPILTPADPDPIIAIDIMKIAQQEGCRLVIGLMSNDTGYFKALVEAKKAGAWIKVILPNGNNSKSLRDIADEVTEAKEYANFYTNPLCKIIEEPTHPKETPPLISNSLHIMNGGA